MEIWIEIWQLSFTKIHFDELVQERRNSIANALELHLSCTNQTIWKSCVHNFNQFISAPTGLQPLPYLSASSRMMILCRPLGSVTFFWANSLIFSRTTVMPLKETCWSERNIEENSQNTITDFKHHWFMYFTNVCCLIGTKPLQKNNDFFPWGMSFLRLRNDSLCYCMDD